MVAKLHSSKTSNSFFCVFNISLRGPSLEITPQMKKSFNHWWRMKQRARACKITVIFRSFYVGELCIKCARVCKMFCFLTICLSSLNKNVTVFWGAEARNVAPAPIFIFHSFYPIDWPCACLHTRGHILTFMHIYSCLN